MRLLLVCWEEGERTSGAHNHYVVLLVHDADADDDDDDDDDDDVDYGDDDDDNLHDYN